MQQLNFPKYDFRFKQTEGNVSIFDVIRKRFIILTPEEWVRQNVVTYLIRDKNYPKSLINVEKVIKVGPTTKRYDIVVYKSDGTIELLVECKAPEIKISQNTFDQIARYNFVMRSQFLMVTNGLNHYYCKMDYQDEKYIFISEISDYKTNTVNT